MTRIGRVAALALPLILSGCDLLYAYMDPFPAGPDGFQVPANPAPPKSYAKGQATIEFTQAGTTETILLSRVDPGSSYDPLFGAIVTFRGEDGWSLSVNAYDDSTMGDLVLPGIVVGDVTINHVAGNSYWTAGTYTSIGTGNGCSLNVWEMTDSKLEGRANCSKLRWVDGMSPGLYSPNYVEGQESFDMSVTFVAEPSSAPPGTTT